MIFKNNSVSSTEAVSESKYELGVSGALMHVYENECNFNAIVKSVGLSELKYYTETGKDLFLNEAGAFSSFIAKVKAFFKKVLEKIKAIFNKFMAVMNSFMMKDKEFVKKYSAEIRRKSLKDLEFNGYAKLAKGSIDVKNFINDSKFEEMSTLTDVKASLTKYSEDINEEYDTNRGEIVKKNGSKLTRTEMLEELREACYGDKEIFEVDDSIRTASMSIIENTKDVIKKLDEKYKAYDKAFKEAIKNLEKAEKDFNGKTFTADNVTLDDSDDVSGQSATDAKANKAKDYNKNSQAYIKNYNQRLNIARELADDATAIHGFLAGMFKDQNRQARAICVKIIGHKEESARLESANDIFAGVQLV